MINNEIATKLKSTKSSDRRQAAKAIGKLKIKQAGEQLFDAFLKEKKDLRTWETKVEMILALGLIEYKAALSEMEMITKANLPHDMVTYAAAITFVRLKRETLADSSPAIQLLTFGRLSVVTGALIPIGNDRMIPSDNEICELINLSWDLHQHPDRVGLSSGYLDPRYGLALACAGWKKDLTLPFLNHCVATSGKDGTIKSVAELALKGKYGKSR